MSNDFGFELWRHGPAGNYVMSPASIAATLAMVWTGARGKTAAQLADVLHLDGDVDEVARVWGERTRALRAKTDGLTLAIANRLFGHRAYTFEAAFAQRLQAAFDAPMETLDFAGDPDRARVHVNRWVAEQTEHAIENLLPEGALTPLTRLVLVNAIYFLGKWATSFDPKATTDKAFWLTATTSKPVPTMQRTARFRIGEAGDGELIELPYRGDTAAMYVIVPTARDGLAKLEKKLDARAFAKWQSGLVPTTVALELPRFTVSPASVRINDMLQALGMKLPFDAARADFTGMAKPANAADALYLEAVYHKAFVKTDEEGTVAAAATAGVMAARGGRPPPPRPFVVDRPFLFAIADVRSGLVLFLGRVVEP